MSNAISGPEAEYGQHASASVAPSVLAALQSRHLEKLIDENGWHEADASDFHRRVVVPGYSFPDALVINQQSRPRPASSTSSMAVSVTATQSSAFMGSFSEPREPSLDSRSTKWSDRSLRTSRADSVLMLETLDETTDGSIDRADFQPHRVLACSYNFLGCEFLSRNLEQWDTHCKSHFHGRIPRALQCPFDCDWTTESATGEEAWQARKNHIWSIHGLQGMIATSRRPESSLIQHLWRERIIDNAQQKELRINGRLTGSHTFLRSGGSLPDDRRRRHQRDGVRA